MEAPGLSERLALANMLKTMIGSGVLTLPWACAQFGLVASVVGLFGLAWLTMAGIALVTRCAYGLRELGDPELDKLVGNGAGRRRDDGGKLLAERESTWEFVSFGAFGRRGKMATLLLLGAAQVGVSASYCDYVVATLEAWGLGAAPAFVAATSCLALLSLLRSFRSIAWFSAAALVVYAYVLGLVFFYSTAADDDDDGGLGRFALLFARPAGLGAFFGPALYCFEGIGTAISIHDAMVPPGVGGAAAADARKAFSKVLTRTYVATFAVYVAVAACSIASWGYQVQEVILYSLPENGLRASAQDALAVVLAFSFVLQMQPVHEIAEATLAPLVPRKCWPLTRVLLVALVSGLARAVPDMRRMVALTGAVSFAAIGFVLPAAFFLKLKRREDRHKKDDLLCAGLLFVGTVGGTWGLVAAVRT